MELIPTVKQEYDREADDVSGNKHTKDHIPGNSDHNDFYDEEIMLLVDFEKCLKMDDTQQANTMHIKVIGIDSEQPIIQVNDEMYRGTYDHAFGTNVFFEKDPERTATLDPVFEKNIKQMYRYVSKTDKVLRMKRIFATQKDKANENETPDKQMEGSSSDEERYDEKYELDMTYEDALNLHLPKGCIPPRHISEKQNGACLVKNPSISESKFEKGESSLSK